MAISIEDVRNGTVAQLTPAQLAKLAGKSTVTISRKIKSKQIFAKEDPTTGRPVVPAEAVLSYLDGKPYKHDHLNQGTLEKMQYARMFKGIKTA